MKNTELLEVLKDTNKHLNNPVEESVLEKILSIVMLNPLEEDRGTSQEQIRYIIFHDIEV